MHIVSFVGMPGGSEWFVILVVALLLFGKRLPEVARSMGRSITEFKKGLHTIEEDIQREPEQEKPKNSQRETGKEEKN